MSTVLDIVNRCLGTMGEVPLNSLSTPHAFKGAARAALKREQDRIQGMGWWYNTEELDLTPSPDDGSVNLPGDCLKIDFGFYGRYSTGSARSPTGQPQTRYVQRGSRLYDLVEGTYVITENLRVQVIRNLAFELIPACVQEYIEAEAVLKFQSSYDGDNNRRQELVTEAREARLYAMAENTRQLGVNLNTTNPRLQRIKSVTRRVRNYN